jgi:hypothetical protein
MPKDTDDIEVTEAEAKAHIAEHEKKHGHEMKEPPGQAKKNDVPTQAELDADITEGDEA